MSVMIQVDFLLYPVGHSDFLHAFFSTVCSRLEHGRWGSRYPYLMNSLYQGRLEWTDISLARKELEEVARRLKRHPPSSVVWDIDDLSSSSFPANKVLGLLLEQGRIIKTGAARGTKYVLK